jgi:tetratricopeptide (TPR) repeat protein
VLALDADMPEPHCAFAIFTLCSGCNWPDAEREFQLGVRAPQPDAWMPYMFLLWAMGRTDDALRLVHKALAVEPASVVWRLKEADLLFNFGQPDAAAKAYDSIIVDAPDDPRAYFALAELRQTQQQPDQAIALYRKAYTSIGLDDDAILRTLATAHGVEGCRRVEEIGAQLELDQLADRAAANKYASPLDYARAHARLGHKEEAFRYLEAAFAERSPGLVFLKVDRAWNQIRDDSHFRDAVKRIGLS